MPSHLESLNNYPNWYTDYGESPTSSPPVTRDLIYDAGYNPDKVMADFSDNATSISLYPNTTTCCSSDQNLLKRKLNGFNAWTYLSDVDTYIFISDSSILLIENISPPQQDHQKFRHWNFVFYFHHTRIHFLTHQALQTIYLSVRQHLH